jgi:Putative zinc-finger
MSTRFACDDTETLVAYLYDEVDAHERDDVARHLAGCARCRDEVAALGGVRHALTGWAPPSPDLRFTVVSETAASNVVRPQVPAWQSVPRWAQLVAATLALAVGAAVANIQVRHDAQGWTVSTGWTTPSVAPVPAPSDEAWRQAFTEFQTTVRRELAARPAATPAPAAPAAPTSEPAVLQRVAALIEASEKRQTQELARRVTQVTADFDLQRQADLVRINQGLNRLDTRTTSDLAQQRELLNVLVRTGLRPPQ